MGAERLQPAADASGPHGHRRRTALLVRAYLWSRVQQLRLFRLLESVLTGLWLGVLSQRALDSVDDVYYVGTGGRRESEIDYEDEAYNRQGLFSWERRGIEDHFPSGGSIALLGAGGGREVLALRRSGYEVDGWECQPSFVTSANRLLQLEGFEPSVVHVPRNTVPDEPGLYDGLIVGWGVYSLVPSRERRVALLRRLRARVGVGAPILLSFHGRSAGDARYRIAARVGNAIRYVRRGERLAVGDYLVPNLVHAFVEEEIASELVEGGFELRFCTRRPYGHAVAVAVQPTAVNGSSGTTSAGTPG